MKRIPFLLISFISAFSFSQNITVKGKIVDQLSKSPLENASIYLDERTDIKVKTDVNGDFILSNISFGDYILVIEKDGYLAKKIPINLSDIVELNLGAILLENDVVKEASLNLIVLGENDLSDGNEIESTMGLLQSSKDIFLTRAAFDFGQVFFSVRGYGSDQGVVLINGIPMNKMFSGRPQWNNWGGLNDVTRNQEFTNGLSPSEYSFGGILGTTNISTRASEYRKGLRVSTSASNRTYLGRAMATYNSGLKKNGLAYSLSASRRWGKEGFIEGTFYDSYSFFGALEYKIGKHSVNLTGFYSPNKRGQSAAITKEVFELKGRQYNPYWGIQDGKIRNSRVREINEPIVMFSHFFESEKTRITTSFGYQFGKYGRSRIGYFNAPNPDPVYYRYLPSYYINASSGANFENATIARDGFLSHSQLDWSSLYNANSLNDGKSVYVLYDDRVDDTQFTFSSIANIDVSNSIKIDAGVSYKSLSSDNYAIINDLLGGSFHEDIDAFSNTRNDLNNDPIKNTENRFNYNYLIDATQMEGFAQVQISKSKWGAFASGNFSNTSYERDGQFLNERFQENSFGKSETVDFSNYAIKTGFNYKINGRHIVGFNGAYLTKAPVIQNTFINPRENNEIVKNILSETIYTGDMSYFLKLPNLTARLTGYYTKFEDATDVNFFFVQGGVGTDFVQEVVTGIDKLNVGGELGIVYKASPSVKLSAVASYGKHEYDSDANVSINFDTVGEEEDIISQEGFLDLGKTTINDYKLSNGPQTAYSFGIEYRDPKYWWVSMTANYLADRYINISTITRTQSFKINPDDPEGGTFPDATKEAISNLLTQEKLDNIYLLNLVGGKSWIIKGKYVSFFASVNNVFDVTYRTGGYEQSRNGNFGQLSRDESRGTPSFGSKYWYGFGRTYFLNLSINF